MSKHIESFIPGFLVLLLILAQLDLEPTANHAAEDVEVPKEPVVGLLGHVGDVKQRLLLLRRQTFVVLPNFLVQPSLIVKFVGAP